MSEEKKDPPTPPAEPTPTTVKMKHEGGEGVGSFTLSIGKLRLKVVDGVVDVPPDAVEAAITAGFRAA